MRSPALIALTPTEAARLADMATPRDDLDRQVLAHLRHLLDRCADLAQQKENP